MSYFSIPTHIFTVNNSLWEAESHIKSCGKRALIVTGKHICKSPMVDSLKKCLEKIQVAYRVFDGVTGEPTVKMIEEGVACYRRGNCDFCIGIGGGSSIDSAKAIAAMSVNSGKISNYNGVLIEGNIPPIVAIPTTSGTGSEGTKFTVITDTEKEIKMLLKGKCLLPKIAIINPDFSIDMPKSLTAATGIDALTHAVEAYTSTKAMPLTDTFAISAVKRIMKYLPIAYNNGFDVVARKEMSIAALEAGICINNSSVTLVHGMSRPMGAMFHITHGISNAMLLTECLEFALNGAYPRFAILGRAIGVACSEDSDKEASHKFLEKIIDLCEICDIPTLKEYGIDRDEFLNAVEKMALDAVASESTSNTRKAVTTEDCVKIYNKLYEKQTIIKTLRALPLPPLPI